MTVTPKIDVKAVKKWIINHRWEGWLFLVLVISFGIFLTFLGDYGAGYDEPLLYEYADRNLDAYSKMMVGDPIDPLLEFYDLPYYGSGYLTLGQLSVNGLSFVTQDLDTIDRWHIVNFLVFLVCGWLVYILTSMIASKPAALFAAILFLTQPLLWGHGIINPKDIPFMTFFSAAVITGLKMTQYYSSHHQENSEKPGFLSGCRINKLWKLAIFFVLLLLFIDRVFNNIIFKPVISGFLAKLYNALPGSVHYKLLTLMADPANLLPIENYLNKMMRWVNLFEFLILGGVLLIGLLVWLKKSTPFWRWLLIAGLFSGLAFGIRILGPAASGLVIAYFLLHKPKKSVLPIFVYSILILLVVYIAWPFLWGHPLTGLGESIKVMAEFPWKGEIRFEGQDLHPDSLPWYYLPKLIGIQFTLPVIVLSMIGSGILLWRILNKHNEWSLGVVLLSWFWIPLIMVILIQPNMYDNFRQFLFITPPLFVMAGVSWDMVGKKFPRSLIWKSATIMLLLPGIISGIWLHPYEYVYYNVFVGWTGGINRTYENDYWGTSMCEAGTYLSGKTQNIELVAITDQTLSHLFARCTTHPFDLRVEREEKTQINPDYAVILSRYDDDLDYFREYQIDHSIKRGNTIFTVIKAPI